MPRISKILIIIAVAITSLSLWAFVASFIDLYDSVKGFKDMLLENERRDKVELQMIKNVEEDIKSLKELNQKKINPIKKK